MLFGKWVTVKGRRHGADTTGRFCFLLFLPETTLDMNRTSLLFLFSSFPPACLSLHPSFCCSPTASLHSMVRAECWLSYGTNSATHFKVLVMATFKPIILCSVNQNSIFRIMNIFINMQISQCLIFETHSHWVHIANRGLVLFKWKSCKLTGYLYKPMGLNPRFWLPVWLKELKMFDS